jgi:hypothetical protein
LAHPKKNARAQKWSWPVLVSPFTRLVCVFLEALGTQFRETTTEASGSVQAQDLFVFIFQE